MWRVRLYQFFLGLLLGHELLAVYINGCSGLCNVTDWEIWHMSFHTGFRSYALDIYLRYACLVDDLYAEAAPMALLLYVRFAAAALRTCELPL